MQRRELPDRERELERAEGAWGPDPLPSDADVAHAARGLLDEQENDRSRRFRVAFPTLRWAAVAAFVLVAAVPTLSPGLRATVSDWFVAEDIQSAGGPAVNAGSSVRQSEAGAPAAGDSKSGEVVTSTGAGSTVLGGADQPA